MTYMEVLLPINLKWREVPDKCYYFDKLSAKELTAYYEWFQAVIPVRIDQLTGAVRGTPGYESWAPDFTPDSLLPLGAWFASQVAVSKVTYEEKQALRSQMVSYLAVSQEALTERTYSIAFDVGVYFGEVVRRNVASTEWDQVLADRRNVNFGQAVVSGRGRVPLEPIGVVQVVALKVVNGTASVAHLNELYTIWSRKLAGES